MMKKILSAALLLLLSLPGIAQATDYCNALKPEINEYIEQLVKKYDFDREKLQHLFCTVTFNEEVVTKLNKPAESKPWYVYEALLITPERIDKGVAYWNAHEQVLANAEKTYGVPASIIIAIIGVETKYGENKGNYSVFNTLATLGFDHGRREKFFRSELTEFLLLSRENQFRPLQLKGSYAGAVGLPQFMPSSYRNYAVDFDSDGFIDLFENNADAIGSIGNYLKKHGWKTGEQIAIAAQVEGGGDPAALVKKGLKPSITLSELAANGITPVSPIPSDKAAVIQLEEKTGPAYWIGLQNFYVISTYNKSELYVMAVTELASKIREKKYHSQLNQVNIPEPQSSDKPQS